MSRSSRAAGSAGYFRRATLEALTLLLVVTGWGAFGGSQARAQDPGVTDTTLRVGGVMPLEGDTSGLGQGMKAGIEAALKGQSVKGHRIEFIAVNDFYNPDVTVKATQELIQQGVFAMLGNVGTPTAQAALPILAEHHIPAVGFFTGASLLRPGKGDILNYRASYIQEIAQVIEAALAGGIKPNEICAFVQNDAYGMAGIEGIKAALAKQPGANATLEKLDRIMALQDGDPARNDSGPVGVYPRTTLTARSGYNSLKNWEKSSNTPCRLVVTVGTYKGVGNLIAYARSKGEHWMFSTVSFTGADSLKTELTEQGVADRVIMTQVAPALNSSLPIVQDARRALGEQLGYVSLEGYIVGRMFLEILRRIDGPLTQENFLKAARGQTFDLGGLKIDFSNDNQGSDLVVLTYLQKGNYDVIIPDELKKLFKQ